MKALIIMQSDFGTNSGLVASMHGIYMISTIKVTLDEPDVVLYTDIVYTPFCQIPWLSFYARHGYVVASIDYRVTGMDIFPAQIQDVKAAIRYLRVHTEDYGIDTERVAVMGDSAGGHLAALAGSSGNKETFGTPDYPNISCRVSAVADLYGPTDFFTMSKPYEAKNGLSWQPPESLLLGGHPTVKAGLAGIRDTPLSAAAPKAGKEPVFSAIMSFSL